MKKIMIIGFVLMLFLVGCNINLNGFEMIDSKYKFEDYQSFSDLKDDLDKDYFAVERVEVFELKQVESLEVGTISEDILVTYEKRDDIEIRYYGIFSSLTDEKRLKYDIESTEDAKFIVKWENLIGVSHARMEVILPESFKLDFKLNTVSGDIDGQTFVGDALNINTVSGDVTVQSMICEKLNINSVSGDSVIDKLEAESVDINTTSGDITIDSCAVKDSKFNSVSGDISLMLKKQLGDITIDTVSGDVVLSSSDFDAAVRVNTLSGDIQTDVDINNVSMKKHKGLEGTIGEGQYDIRIDTLSGDVTLK